jgi:HNH endonuclease
MNFWWVNQNLTYRQECDGGYLWSPKTNTNGSKSHYYDNMRRVAPGEIVFSFRDTRIPSIGIIQSPGYSAPRPQEFPAAGSSWRNDGWKVDVEYHPLTNRIRPIEHIDRIRPMLPTKYSPLKADGNGNQVYLTQIPEAMADVLVSLIGQEAQAVIHLADEFYTNVDVPPDLSPEAEKIEAEIKADPKIPETEKTALVKARRGQGKYRKNLLAFEKKCRVTGVTNLRHLVASHMKPWVESTNAEKLDGANGLLLAPHVDHLFDGGYISFADDGNIVVSPKTDREVLHQLNVNIAANVGPFHDKQLPYLAYHRKFRLRR